MTNLERIQKLTDESLIREVAAKVMGWSPLLFGWDGSVTMPGSPPPGGASQEWQPLTDWNHTMQVDHAISMQPYTIRERFQNALMLPDKWYADVSQRDILEAALLAMERGDS